MDPGLVGTGYAVLEAAAGDVAVRGAGVIETRANLPLAERVHRIYEGVLAILDTHAPSALVLEDLYSEYDFPRSALLMAHARGVICLAAHQRGVAVLALAPAEVKRAVALNGAASKEQIQHGMQRLLMLAELPRPAHVADALALAFTGLSRIGSRLRRPSPSEGVSTAAIELEGAAAAPSKPPHSRGVGQASPSKPPRLRGVRQPSPSKPPRLRGELQRLRRQSRRSNPL